jgi:hypothetical protein
MARTARILNPAQENPRRRRRGKRRNPKKNVGGWLLPVAIVGAIVLIGGIGYGVAHARKKKTSTPGGTVQIPDSAWGSGERIRVPSNTTIKTVAWTFFPEAQIGLLADRLSDKGQSMDMQIDSEAWTGGPSGYSGHHEITIATGSARGPAEVRAQSGSGDDRTELLLQIG